MQTSITPNQALDDPQHCSSGQWLALADCGSPWKWSKVILEPKKSLTLIKNYWPNNQFLLFLVPLFGPCAGKYKIKESFVRKLFLQNFSIWLIFWSQSNENNKTDIFRRFFLITNFCVKIVANTNKKIWRGHIDWKLTFKKNKLFSLIWWLSVALQTVWLNAANILCG